MNINYGSESTTDIIDDQGSTLTVTTKLHAGVPQKPQRKDYKIRYRTNKNNLAELGKIAEDILTDPSKFDIKFEVEKTKTGETEGYLNLIACYSTLRY